MTRYVTVNESYANQTLRMMTDVQGNPVIVQAGNLVMPNLFDHVVTAVADLPAAVAGYHELSGGSWAFIRSIDLGTNSLRIPVGTTVYLTAFGWAQFLTSSANTVILVEGTLLVENMRITSGVGGGRIFIVNNAAAIFRSHNTNTVVGSGATNLYILSATSVQMTFDSWSGAGNSTSVGFNGNITADLRIVGHRSTGQGVFLTRTSGTVGFASITACWTNATTGINWAAANIPTNGLIVNGNALLGATPYSGFNPATVRVNFKLNTTTANLLPETPIVP